MSTIPSEPARQELRQLLQTRSQVIENALVRTLDDKCSSSHFNVVRGLLNDQERLIRLIHGLDALPMPGAKANPRSLTTPAPLPAKRAGFVSATVLTVLLLAGTLLACLVSKAVQSEQFQRQPLRLPGARLVQNLANQGGGLEAMPREPRGQHDLLLLWAAIDQVVPINAGSA